MGRGGRAALLLLLSLASLAEGSRGRCDYGNIDRRGGRWVIPQKCTHLYLSQVGFGQAGSRQMGEAMRSNTFVTEIDSSSCNIQGGAKYFEKMLAENTALGRFNLGNNRIDDVGVEAIARGLAVNKGLKGLYLPNNRIGAAGAAALGEALKTNTVLETLNLDSNRLGDDGAIALAKGLAENRGLRSLVLGGNDIGNEGAQALALAVQANPTLKARLFRCVSRPSFAFQYAAQPFPVKKNQPPPLFRPHAPGSRITPPASRRPFPRAGAASAVQPHQGGGEPPPRRGGDA